MTRTARTYSYEQLKLLEDKCRAFNEDVFHIVKANAVEIAVRPPSPSRSPGRMTPGRGTPEHRRVIGAGRGRCLPVMLTLTPHDATVKGFSAGRGRPQSVCSESSGGTGPASSTPADSVLTTPELNARQPSPPPLPIEESPSVNIGLNPNAKAFIPGAPAVPKETTAPEPTQEEGIQDDIAALLEQLEAVGTPEQHMTPQRQMEAQRQHLQRMGYGAPMGFDHTPQQYPYNQRRQKPGAVLGRPINRAGGHAANFSGGGGYDNVPTGYPIRPPTCQGPVVGMPLMANGRPTKGHPQYRTSGSPPPTTVY